MITGTFGCASSSSLSFAAAAALRFFSARLPLLAALLPLACPGLRQPPLLFVIGGLSGSMNLSSVFTTGGSW
jgi:hypothetical protein